MGSACQPCDGLAFEAPPCCFIATRSHSLFSPRSNMSYVALELSDSAPLIFDPLPSPAEVVQRNLRHAAAAAAMIPCVGCFHIKSRDTYQLIACVEDDPGSLKATPDDSNRLQT
jgi:hypothetical protein